MDRPLKVIGLMSGTSLDGVDAAVLETDGRTVVSLGPTLTLPYTPQERAVLKAALDAAAGLATRANDVPPAIRAAEALVTAKHEEAVRRLSEMPGATGAVLVGFHGQTVLHRPGSRWTWQIGQGEGLASALGCDVVFDFRAADVAAGGQGAPLVPLYHQALARPLMRPGEALAVLNIGGVANVTWLGPDERILAFDTGPGNAPIDDWAMEMTGRPIDADGALSAAGSVDALIRDQVLDHPWFDLAPPKSLDRFDFTAAPVRGLAAADGAATLTAITAGAVGRAREHMAIAPSRWVVCGGGRHNPSLMRMLRDVLGVPVEPCDVHGWRGDFIEAEAFGFLAVRSVRALALSLPETTGVPQPQTGGVLARRP